MRKRYLSSVSIDEQQWKHDTYQCFFVTQLKKNIDILFFFVVWYVLHLISEIWFVRTNVANVLSHRKKNILKPLSYNVAY